MGSKNSRNNQDHGEKKPKTCDHAANMFFTSTRPPSLEESLVLTAGLSLAGGPLEPPCFHHTDWEVGQRFRASDDPDRTSEAWKPPGFVTRDPRVQHAKMSVDELKLPQKPCPESFARIVRGALDEEDCAELISAVNAKGFTPALLNMGRGTQRLNPEARDGFRVIVDSEPLSSWLFEVLRPFLPEVVQDDGECCRLQGLNERCRFLCYTPGQKIGAHYDARFTHPRTMASSCVTVQLYLHDVPVESGGATTFVFNERGVPDLPCQPSAGSLLVFSQDLEHEGSCLRSGLKYTFRTEAMYKK